MDNKYKKFKPDPDKVSLNLAIVGGGRICKFFLDLVKIEPFDYLDIKILGVCDIDPGAEGLVLAKEMGLFTTHDFRDLFKLKGLDGVLELTNSSDVLLELMHLRPKGVGVLEHNIGRFLRRFFLIDQKLKSAEKQVYLQKMASEFFIQQANERIMVLNTDFTISEANEAVLKAINKSKEEVIGAHCYEIIHGLSTPCSSSHPELGCPLLETLRTGESAHVIHERSQLEGYPTYSNIVAYPLKDQAGKVVQVIEVWQDITEALSLRWENRVKTLKDDLQKLIQEDRICSLGKLVASCVHEINNPIQGLLTFSHLMQEILAEGKPNSDDLKKFQDFLSLMSRELERCGNIISGLLSFSRESPISHKEIDLNELMGSVLTLTHHKMELQNIRLTTDLPTMTLMVKADENQLQQCFINLIFNAIEAMPQGGELTVISRLDNNKKNALMEIGDTGHGIPKENLDHIFDPFFTTKGEGEGTGLGLSIVHGVVKTHEGEINVKSEVGKGTTFTLSFPVQT